MAKRGYGHVDADAVSDRRFGILTVIDDFIRECLGAGAPPSP